MVQGMDGGGDPLIGALPDHLPTVRSSSRDQDFRDGLPQLCGISIHHARWAHSFESLGYVSNVDRDDGQTACEHFSMKKMSVYMLNASELSFFKIEKRKQRFGFACGSDVHVTGMRRGSQPGPEAAKPIRAESIFLPS